MGLLCGGNIREHLWMGMVRIIGARDIEPHYRSMIALLFLLRSFESEVSRSQNRHSPWNCGVRRSQSVPVAGAQAPSQSAFNYSAVQFLD